MSINNSIVVKFIRGNEGIYIGVTLQVHYLQCIAQLDTLPHSW